MVKCSSILRRFSSRAERGHFHRVLKGTFSKSRDTVTFRRLPASLRWRILASVFESHASEGTWGYKRRRSRKMRRMVLRIVGALLLVAATAALLYLAARVGAH